MDEHLNASAAKPACKNVFRDGSDKTTSEKFTKKWIELINRLEKDKQVTLCAAIFVQGVAYFIFGGIIE